MQTVLVCAASDRGLERDNNEDGFIVADLSSEMAIPADDEVRVQIGNRGILLAVCDGMGGHDNGALAARIATTTILREMLSMNEPLGRSPEDRLRQALKAANRRICEEAVREFGQVGMGTTCTAGLLLPDRLVIAQVGDSRAYLHRNATLVQLTRDQSLVATMLESGALTPEQAASYPDSNIILQALGASESLSPAISEVPIMTGDEILLESDGLHGQVADNEILSILSVNSSPSDCSKSLVEASLAAGGADNVTVVLACVE